MKRSVKRLLGLLLVLLILTGLLPAGVNAAPITFGDVPAGAWYYRDVYNAVETGLINGYPDGTFGPENNLTCAEAVKLAAIMHKVTTTGSSDFNTYGSDPWYRPYADYARSVGILQRTGYNWDAAATRIEYMEMFAHAIPDGQSLARGSALTAINDIPDDSIPDVSIHDFSGPDIYKLYRAGIVQGIDDRHTCSPHSSIKRSEVAAILSRMMNADERLSFSMGNGGQTGPNVPVNPIQPSASALAINAHPIDATVNRGGKISFVMAVSGGQAPYSYQWYNCQQGKNDFYPINNNSTWSISNQGNTSSLTVTDQLMYDNNGIRYRCEVTDASGAKLTSNAATLTVENKIIIAKQSADKELVNGRATMYVEKSEDIIPCYFNLKRWENGSWEYLLEKNSIVNWLSYSFWVTTPGAYLIELINRDDPSDVAYSDQFVIAAPASAAPEPAPASATPTPSTSATTGISVVNQSADKELKNGKASIYVEKSNVTIPAYFNLKMWNGSSWEYVGEKNSLVYSQSYTFTVNRSGIYLVELINRNNPSDKAYAGQFYIAPEASSSNTVTSAATPSGSLKILIEPQDKKVHGSSNYEVNVRFSGGKKPVTVKWFKTDPKGVTNVVKEEAFNTTGNNSFITAYYSSKELFYASEADGTKIYCTITDAAGATVMSRKATITGYPYFSTNVKDTSAPTMWPASFSVAVKSGRAPYTYEWHRINIKGEDMKIIAYSKNYTGYNTATLGIEKCYYNMNGEKYYCIVTDADGDKITSKEGTLKVLKP